MDFFMWKGSLTVGIGEIDHEHRELIDSLNQMHDAMAAGASRLVFLEMLSRLIVKAEEHFLHEEIMWKAGKYLDQERHRDEHANLLRTACEFRAKYAAGRIAMSQDVLNGLRGWIENHIMVSDKEAAAALLGGSRPDTHQTH